MAKFKKRLIIFMPSMEGGGVEKNLILVSNYLIKYFENITLITFDNKFNNRFNYKIKIINSNYKSNKRYSKYFKYFACIILLINEIIKKETPIIFSFQANIYCCLLSLFFNFNLIVRSNTAPAGWNKNILKKFIFKIFLKRAKYIIVNSADFKKDLDKEFKVNSKLIYNPLNILEIKRLSKEKLVEKIYSKNSLKIINIGRFTDQKDHITLLKAFKEVRKKTNCELLIMGYGVKKLIIKNFIEKNKLKKYIKILNYKKNPYKYLAKSNLFVLTSLYEGLPNVLLESLALKKLVISTDCPTGPREILKNGKYGILFKTQDYIRLSKIILSYNKNIQNYKKISNAGYKSLDRFDFTKNCKKYLDIIKKCI